MNKLDKKRIYLTLPVVTINILESKSKEMGVSMSTYLTFLINGVGREDFLNLPENRSPVLYPLTADECVPGSDIKPAFNIGTPRHQRFLPAGVNKADVIRAKRNKAHNREYDKTLEEYFDKI